MTITADQQWGVVAAETRFARAPDLAARLAGSSGPDLRLMQELVLGIGGWRLLAALGIEPEVCHLNEGHAALAVLERARSFMQATGQPLEAALAVTRAGNLFTTLTAVAAGFDRFAPTRIERCPGGYARTQLGITLHDLLALSRRNPDDASEPLSIWPIWRISHCSGELLPKHLCKPEHLPSEG